MPQIITPEKTNREEAFRLWIQAPMPMLTLVKTIDVTHLVHLSRRKKLKFNALFCWCIGKAAVQVPEFFLLPMQEYFTSYDELAISVVVRTEAESIATCDIPWSDQPEIFYQNYIDLCSRTARTGVPYDLSENYMVIGTSALPDHKLDAIINIYAGIYNNPFLLWGKYNRKFFSYSVPVSFQVHHSQMDGEEAAQFLELLQQEINRLRF